MNVIAGQLGNLGYWLRLGVLGVLLVEATMAAAVVFLWPRIRGGGAHGRVIDAIGFFVLAVTSFAAGMVVFLTGGADLLDEFAASYGPVLAVVLILLLAVHQVLGVEPARWVRVRQGLVVVLAPLLVLFAVMAGLILGRILI